MTYNIRYNNPNDGEHAWPFRTERVASSIRFNRADLIGVQEALKNQLDSLSIRLPNHAWLGCRPRRRPGSWGILSHFFIERTGFALSTRVRSGYRQRLAYQGVKIGMQPSHELSPGPDSTTCTQILPYFTSIPISIIEAKLLEKKVPS